MGRKSCKVSGGGSYSAYCKNKGWGKSVINADTCINLSPDSQSSGAGKPQLPHLKHNHEFEPILGCFDQTKIPLSAQPKTFGTIEHYGRGSERETHNTSVTFRVLPPFVKLPQDPGTKDHHAPEGPKIIRSLHKKQKRSLFLP